MLFTLKSICLVALLMPLASSVAVPAPAVDELDR